MYTFVARSLARPLEHTRHTQKNKAKKLTAVFAVSLSLSLSSPLAPWHCGMVVRHIEPAKNLGLVPRPSPPTDHVGLGSRQVHPIRRKKKKKRLYSPPTNSTGLAASAHLPFPRLQISERQRLFNICSQETSAHMFRGPEERHRLPVPNQCIFACVSPVNLFSVDSASIIHFS